MIKTMYNILNKTEGIAMTNNKKIMVGDLLEE